MKSTSSYKGIASMMTSLHRTLLALAILSTCSASAFASDQPGKGTWAKPPSQANYSAESVIASGQRGGDLEPVGTNFSHAYNRSMGEAMETWNAHRWSEAVALFRNIHTEQPDSPWAAEAELHAACYLKYNAAYDEAEDRFLAVLTKYPGNQTIRKKVLHYLPHLYALTGRWGAAQDVLNMMKEFPMNWQERQYYENYARIHLEGGKFDQKERQCGSKALVIAQECKRLAGQGKKLGSVSIEEVLSAHPVAHRRAEHPDGFSLDELAELSGGSAREISFQQLKVLARSGDPIIAYWISPQEPKFYKALGRQKEAKTTEPSGHFVVVETANDDNVTLIDPNSGVETDFSICEFMFRWHGHVLLLPGQGTAGRALGKHEAQILRGGCCGSPPPDPTGGLCDAATTGGGRNGPSSIVAGPGGGSGGCCGFGAPGYRFGIPNQNLILFDTPMWYPPAKGPGMRISLVYNRVNTFNLAENESVNYYAFGNKWSFNYNAFLKEAPNGDVQIVMEDGAMLEYEYRQFYDDYQAKDPRDRSLLTTNGNFVLTLDGSKTQLIFPQSGLATNGQQVTAIRDRFGNQIACNYDGSGRLTNVVDAQQRWFAFQYNTNGFVTNITDIAGRRCVFTYSSSNNLATMRDMGGHETSLQYDENNWVTNITYPNGSALRISHATGIMLGETYDDPAWYAWNNPAFRIKVTDSLDHESIYFYHAFDTMGPVTVEDVGGNRWMYGIKNSLAHGGLNNSKEYVYAEGVNAIPQPNDLNVVGRQWDQRLYSAGDGDITRWRSATGTHLGIVMGYDDLNGPYVDSDFERRFEYTNHWAISEAWYTGGVQYAFWTNRYDAVGNLIKSVDPLTNTFTAGYDTNDNLMAVTNALGDATRFTYNSDGFLASVTNARSYGINFAYTNGLLTSVVFPDTTTVTMTYDSVGRRATVTDSVGHTVSNQYDDFDRLLKLMFPDGSSFDYEFSCCGLDSISDRLGRETTFGYDILRRVTAVTNALGNAVGFGYEPLNNVTSLTWYVNGQARSIKYGYTKDNGFTRRTSRTSPQGKVNSYGYTFRGWPLSDVDGNSRTSSYSYDAIGRLTRIIYSATTNATSDVVIAYDTLSRITSIGDSNSTLTLSYNALSQVRTNTISYVVPGFSNLSYELVYLYDTVGNLTNRRINRLGNVTNISSTAFTYDSLNRLLSVADQYANASYAFGNGRLDSISYGNSDITRLTYDSESRPTSMITSNGASAVQGWYYQIDKMGMMTGITDVASNRWVYEYDAIYQLRKETYNSTNQTIWDYDEIMNRNSQVGGSGTRSYVYNADNEILWSSDSTTALINVTGTVYAGAASNKWYDSWATTRGLSTRVDTNNGGFTITNVPVAETNSLLVTVQDVSGNIASQAVSFTKTLTKTETFVYDLNGNLTNWVVGNLTNAFSYDQQDRLVKVTSNGVVVLESWYDAIGRRIAKREVKSGQTNEVIYVYDGWSPLAVLDRAGNILEVYTRGNGIAQDIGTLVAATYLPGASSTGTYYLLNNHRGDVTGVRSGVMTVATVDYRPFGETRFSTGNIDLRYRFSSMELDQSVGIYFYGFRSYSPVLGVWTSQEPLGEAASLNLHAFVANNPIRYVDILGLRDVDVYVWEWQGDGVVGVWPGSRVGHVMVTEHNSKTVLLSQFPVPRGAREPNVQFDYEGTFMAEASLPDRKFIVHVPDDKSFDAMVASHVARKWWAMRPKGSEETHCTRAAYDALKAGGVPLSGQDKGQLLPGSLGRMLEDLIGRNSSQNAWSIRYGK